MLNTVTRVATCFMLLGALTACAKKAGMEARPAAEIAAIEPKIIATVAPPAQADTTVTAATPAEQMGSSAATYVDSERKFIRTASANFDVKDVYVAALGIEDKVGAHGGFVVKNDITTNVADSRSQPARDGKLMVLDEYKVHAVLIVRVPSARTQEFMRAIVGHVVFLNQRSFEARDAQFELLRRQLDAMRNQETQTDLGDAIEDGGKLAQRAAAITARGDVKAARDAALLEKKEFEDAVAFSTIELTLNQPNKVLQSERVDLESTFHKTRPGFFSRLGDQLSGGWYGLLDFVLVMTGIWPALLVLGAVVAVVLRIRRGRALKRSLQHA